jgi:hypothetical protein
MSGSASVDPGTIMYTKDWLTLIALLVGPLVAVRWTLWHQDRKDKRSIKERLFIELMAHRKSFPISPNWAKALNVIDVVFADDPKVIAKWHRLYDVLCERPVKDQPFQHASLELMSEIAKSLGYAGLQQTDIDKFYMPDLHAKEARRLYRIQMHALRVLRRSKSFVHERPEKDVEADYLKEKEEDGEP